MDIKYPWIKVENGDVFEGHQLHWVNCFLVDEELDNIKAWCFENDWKIEVSEMTEEQLEKYPEIIMFIESRENWKNEV